MTIKFYSWWTSIMYEVDQEPKQTEREFWNTQVQDLANELNTVLGDYELISMTSAATNGIVVTTIAYEDGENGGLRQA